MTITSTAAVPFQTRSSGEFPTSYFTDSLWLPATLITEAQPTVTSPTAVGQPAATGTAPPLPNVIAPSGGIPAGPEDSTLVQIGFTYALNYPFIVAHPLAVAQIFDYLPRGVSYGLGVNLNETVMVAIQPYETGDDSFVVSLAMMYVSTDMLNTLMLGLYTPSSLFYNSPDPSVQSLMGLIDPTIPLVASTGGGGESGFDGGDPLPGSGGGAFGGSNSSSNPDVDIGSTILFGSLDSATSASATNKKVVAIAIGTVCGVVLYGAFVFIMGRRYRRKVIARASRAQMRQISQPMPYIANVHRTTL
ncbi:hypothetical protein V1512DRAFT_257702 [Lipomyces arxii]|uniref:uncharacterized protein n=1 Tax=Lipomyces arxii TaxID=56418 RepID=UPI0034CED231